MQVTGQWLQDSIAQVQKPLSWELLSAAHRGADQVRVEFACRHSIDPAGARWLRRSASLIYS
jgi:hypothetical protein